MTDVGAQGAGEVGVAGAAHGGDVQSHRRGQLDGERADSSGCSVDQDTCSGVRVAGAQAHERGVGGQG